MVFRRTDLPLDRDAVSRFLPWLIAFMVYLSMLSLAGTMLLSDLAGQWKQGASGSLTVQMAPTDDASGDTRRTRAVLAILRATEGVIRARAMDHVQILALLEPWLGPGGSVSNLPLPLLIEVKVKPNVSLNLERLSQRITIAAPGATIDDHGVWLERLVRLVQTVEALAIGILLLIGFATVLTVVFATRTGLAIHHEVIEVLHLIGAQDSYIARQFAGHALGLGLRGGFIGLVLAALTMLAIRVLREQVTGLHLPDVSLSPLQWAAVAALPLVVAVIAMVSARLTVTRSLARML